MVAMDLVIACSAGVPGSASMNGTCVSWHHPNTPGGVQAKRTLHARRGRSKLNIHDGRCALLSRILQCVSAPCRSSCDGYLIAIRFSVVRR